MEKLYNLLAWSIQVLHKHKGGGGSQPIDYFGLRGGGGGDKNWLKMAYVILEWSLINSLQTTPEICILFILSGHLYVWSGR